MDNEEEMPKKQWTEQERLELAAKLDDDLDAFIDSLERKRYENGWPEDRWQEEFEKHPFFMKKAPQPGDEVHPMLEGLQNLKYDPEENTAEELALNYKVDGNFYMKHKKFRMAIYSFTEGLKAKSDNPELQSVLFNNRSAAHFFLENYRSALADAQKSLEYKKDYHKARRRAAQCAYELKRFELCALLCEEIIENDPNDTIAQELLKKNKLRKLEEERNERKNVAKERKRAQKFKYVCEALEKCKVKYDDEKQAITTVTDEFLKSKFLPLEDYPVHLDEDNETLIWPALFCYPEFLYSDFHQNLSEKATILDVVKSLLTESLPVDKTNSYRPDTVNVYYENRRVGSVHKVDLQKTVRETIQEESFFVTHGSLWFFIVPKNSKIENEFIRGKR